MDLTALEYPRWVHGAGGEHYKVASAEDCAAALAAGYALSPILTPEQVVAVRAARIAAGEIVEEPPAPEPKPEPRRQGRR